jgi:diguanylate cyclase (GGDEF)-like protein
MDKMFTILMMMALLALFFSSTCFAMAQTSSRSRPGYIGLAGCLGLIGLGTLILMYLVTLSVLGTDSTGFRLLALLGNVSYMTSTAFLRFGSDGLSDHRSDPRLFWATLVLGFAIQVVALVTGNDELRASSASVFIALLLVVATLSIWSRREMRRKRFSKIVVTGAMMISVAMMAKVAIGLLSSGDTQSLFSGSTISAIIMAFTATGVCAMPMGVFLLSNEIIREDIVRISEQDSLTGIPNRRALMARSRKLLESAIKKRESFTVMMCDIDHFKKINDTFGHSTGDRTIRDVARVLSSLAGRIEGEVSVIGRYGGEEFCVVARGLSDSQAEAISRSVVETTRRCERSEDRPPVTLSAGTCFIPDASKHSAELLELTLKTADDALYRSKRDGRDRWTFVQQTDSAIL